MYEVASKSDVARLLCAHGINVTLQRLEIAYLLFSRREHLSADRILALCGEGSTPASKATVYNTLSLLVERGLVREVIVDPTRVFYDPNTLPHYHLYNATTGELSDLPSDGVRISGLPPLPDGQVLDWVDVIVRTRASQHSGEHSQELPRGPAIS